MIRYFDLGTYDGMQVDIMLKVLPFFGKFEIYCIEPCENTFNIIENKYKNLNNVKLYNFAINSYDGNCKLYHSKIKPSGNSIFSTKKNLKDGIFEEVDCVPFSILLNYLEIDLNESFNIIKYNIEGAELILFEDLEKNNLFKNFDIIIGNSGDDILKCSEISHKINKFYKICEKNKLSKKHNLNWKSKNIKEEIKGLINDRLVNNRLK
jgi:FkbM family methyltransferase